MKTRLLFLLVVLIAVSAAFFVLRNNRQPVSTINSVASSAETVAGLQKSDDCQLSSDTRYIVVKISDQHLWACDGSRLVYNSAVITGKLANDDLTPLGTYKIYAKETNQVLSGCEPGDCWDDHVAYWMPYLKLANGKVGFHDASWRSSSEFGNTPPSSNKGSHGCVEMTVAAAKWLYDWSSVGTTVAVQS